MASIFLITVNNKVDLDSAKSFFATYLTKQNVPKIQENEFERINIMRLPF